MTRGREQARKFGIHCNQALYSQWGNFYAAITGFPCALFDESGFLLVQSKGELEGLGIRITKRTNVRDRISSKPGYKLLAPQRGLLPEEIEVDDVSAAFVEGAVETVTVNRYERDHRARLKCIEHYGCICAACGLTLSDLYGDAATGFIHVHHVTPISSIGAEYCLDPIRDLRPLCPNCHAIVHLRRDPYSIDEVRRMIRTQGEDVNESACSETEGANDAEKITALLRH